MFWSSDKSLLVQGVSESCMWEHLSVYFSFVKDKTSLVTFIRMREAVAQMATDCLRMLKIDIFVLNN